MIDSKYQDAGERTPEEAERIMNAALKRALNTPPMPHKPVKCQRAKKVENADRVPGTRSD